jgi:hypothetical protein
MDVGDAVRSVAGDVELRASTKERWHYKEPSWGFQFDDLDADDAIEGSLAAAQAADRQAWAELPPGGLAFSEAVTLIIVGIARGIPEGVGKELGADAYRGAKSRIRRWWRRIRDIPREPDQPGDELARLFGELGMAFIRGCLSDGRSVALGPVFIRVLEPDITFLTEPFLPEEAKREAARIALDPKEHSGVRTPLRWDPNQMLWRAMSENWAMRDQLDALLREFIAEVSRAEGETKNR